MSENFLFITSRGRSGSTLLWLLLDNHPAIQIPPEGHFIKYLYASYGSKKKWTEKDKADFVRDLQFDYKLQYWKLDYSKILEDLLALPEDIRFRQVCDLVYASYSSPSRKDKIQIYGDKTPNNSLYLDVLIKLYPKATFVHIVRDYRDVVESFLRVNFESHVVSSLAYRWNMCNKPFLSYQRKYPKQFHIVRYEDLVQNPEQELTRLLTKINLAYTPKMLEFQASFNEIEKGFKYGESSFFKSIKEPINTSKMGVWRSALSEKQIRAAERICGKMGERFGYKTEHIKQPGGAGLRYTGGFLLAQAYPMVDRIIFYLPIRVKRIFYWIYTKVLGPLLQVRKNGGELYTEQRI